MDIYTCNNCGEDLGYDFAVSLPMKIQFNYDIYYPLLEKIEKAVQEVIDNCLKETEEKI